METYNLTLTEAEFSALENALLDEKSVSKEISGDMSATDIVYWTCSEEVQEHNALRLIHDKIRLINLERRLKKLDEIKK